MNKDLQPMGFLFGANSVFIEELYQKYLKNPSSIDPSWHELFQAQDAFKSLKTTSSIIIDDVPFEGINPGPVVLQDYNTKERNLRAKFMIKAYRRVGHYLANLDPLGLEAPKTHAELALNIEDFGFSKEDLSEIIDITDEFGDLTSCSISELYDILNRTYSASLAVEYAHIENREEKKYLYKQLEKANTASTFRAINPINDDDKKNLLQDLVEIEGFEQYLHTKFPGAKRFSIEGGDTSIICLNIVLEESAIAGAEEVVLGLAHRGRLSTLAKVMQKPYRAIFAEFKGAGAFPKDLDVSGDVKYHMGFSCDRTMLSGKKIHLSLMPNPSHLEAINPVVAGKVRAKQDVLGRNRKKIAGILVHGDAAFCGQGVVAESLVMSGLRAYDIGGIIHVVINNQIGFTANPIDARPGRYCTEVAKIVGAPIIHVNGDDVESVVLATKLACNYRDKFSKDVVIDIVCYRKYGHNEGDEPMYTQSVMYNIIKTKRTPAAIYADRLVSENIIADDYYDGLKVNFKKTLDKEFSLVEGYKPKVQWLDGLWSGFTRNGDDKFSTGISKSNLQKLIKELCTIPDSFPLNNKLKKLFETRIETVSSDEPVDWATAEQLAFASLLQANIPIRLTGQDVGRGTFSHRHAVLHSQVDHSIYEPLNNISPDQAFFEIMDSNLSEYAVLGFEYGYSLVNPNHLVIWEAQFGDFCNGAQIIFDQFISSAETKWLRMSGLVCLLPNGMEGQGPEHSSARIERFLQLCAEDNIQVVYPTTPASIFHLFRRQILRNFRKPLIVMSPKSLLRHKLAVSSLSEMDVGTSFKPILDEIDSDIIASNVKKLIFCTGKIYYDLLEKRRQSNIFDIAIIRMEQLYPFKQDIVVDIMSKYSNARQIVWCQEEPSNMGAWKFIRPRMEEALKKAQLKQTISFVGRKEAASPAVGSLYVHNEQQESLVMEALNRI